VVGLKSIAACVCAVVAVAAIALAGSIPWRASGGGGAADGRPAGVRPVAPAVADRVITVRPSSRGRTNYAAIAFNRTDKAVGFGYLFPRRAGAEARALQECRQRSSSPANCRVIAWVGDGCVAVARALRSDGTVSQVTWGIAAKCNSAQSTALLNATRPSSIRVAVHSRAGAVR
jgi:hypothetical protein